MTPVDLDKLSALAENATAGPWMVDTDCPEIVLKPDKPGNSWDGRVIATVSADDYGLIETDNTAFIAASREAIPALIAEVRELRGRIEKADARLFTSVQTAWGEDAPLGKQLSWEALDILRGLAVSAGEEEQ